MLNLQGTPSACLVEVRQHRSFTRGSIALSTRVCPPVLFELFGFTVRRVGFRNSASFPHIGLISWLLYMTLPLCILADFMKKPVQSFRPTFLSHASENDFLTSGIQLNYTTWLNSHPKAGLSQKEAQVWSQPRGSSVRGPRGGKLRCLGFLRHFSQLGTCIIVKSIWEPKMPNLMLWGKGRCCTQIDYQKQACPPPKVPAHFQCPKWWQRRGAQGLSCREGVLLSCMAVFVPSSNDCIEM